MSSREDSAVHVALSTDVNGVITGWNSGCAALFGLPGDQAIGRRLDQLLAEEGREVVSRCMSELPGHCDARDVQVRHSEGEERAADLMLIPTFDAAGRHSANLALFTSEVDFSEPALVGSMPLSQVIDALPGIFYVLREDGTMVLWNHTLERVTARDAEELSLTNALDMYDLADKRIITARMREVFERDAQVFVEANYRSKDGSATPYLLCGARIQCRGRKYLCGMGIDISARRAQEEALRLRERALHATSNGLVITRCVGQEHLVEYANPAFERITGYSAAEVAGRDMRFMAATGLDEDQRELIRRALGERREINVVLRHRRKNGDIFWNDLTITPVDNGHGLVTHFIGVINDVTAARQRTALLEHEVNHDPLTGLANRTLLWDRLEHAINMSQRNKTLVAAVLLDLNGFKQINDTFGHEAGDHVLKVVARRLQASVRDIDTVARLSGDEFVLVLVNQPSLRYTLRMIERLRAGMAQQLPIDGSQTEIGASMGVAVYPHDGANAMDLIRAADTAMYHAKATRKSEVHFFSADMKSTTEAKQKLEHDMRAALEQAEMFLLFQPKVCLRSGRISGFEALLRWRHPEFGVMLPSAFLSDAEENGAIVPIGREVLAQTCAFMQRIQSHGLPVPPVSVNVSYREFSRPHYVAQVAATLSGCGVPPALLELELREGCLYHNHHLGLEVMSELRDVGVQRSVDAFGSVPSDLLFLQRLPLTHLKIARMAVHQIGHNGHSGGALARALIDVAHDLGAKAIAKGVETRLQMDFLKEHACDELQGMYFSEPLTAAAAQELLLATPLDVRAPSPR